MFRRLRPLLTFVAVITAWAVASALFGLYYQIVLPCMLLGIIAATVVLLITNNDETSWLIFIGKESGENRPEEEKFASGLLFGCLFGAPVIILFATLLTWLFSPIINWLLNLP